MICFYHGDLDGIASAAILNYYRYKQGLLSSEDKYIKVNYNDNLYLDKIKNEHVYILDFSLNSIEDFTLLTNKINVTWIDHHKTSIEKYKDFRWVLGKRQDGIAACELTWQYLFENQEIPNIIKLIGDYDVWTFKYGDKTNHLQLGMQIRDTEPTNLVFWDKFLDNNYPYSYKYLDEIINEGMIIDKYRQQDYKKTVDEYKFYRRWEGYNCVVCNRIAPSMLFDSVSEESYDVMIMYIFDGINYHISLRTKINEIDVSKIAQKYGGGGHKGASGFICQQLPF